MFELFHRIIKGDLRPHLIKKKNISELKALFKTVIRVDSESGKIITDSDYLNLCLEVGQKVKIIIDEENPEKNTLTVLPEENLEQLFNFNLPPPPNKKAEMYLTLIEREEKLIKYKISSFLKSSTDIKEIELYALKNIQLLKLLAGDLYIYIKKLGGENTYLEANHFVTYVLKYYIIDIIQYIQTTFSPFIKIELESEYKLKYELFLDYFPGIPSFTIWPFLPKDKEFEDFRKQFFAENKAEHQKNKLNKKEISIAESLFNHYKSKNKSLSRVDQIINLNTVIHYWEELLLKNKLKSFVFDRYINEPEIEKILIPLLKGEIEFLNKVNLTFQKQVSMNWFSEVMDTHYFRTYSNYINGIAVQHKGINTVDFAIRDYVKSFKAELLDIFKRLDDTEKVLFHNELLRQSKDEPIHFLDDSVIKTSNNKYWIELKEYIETLNITTPKVTKTDRIGFLSSLADSQIETLFELLKDKYIDSNTNPDHFKAIFKNERLPDSFDPVKWIEAPVLLVYLIYKLKKHKKIKSPKHWSITGQCFNPKCNLRQLADGFQNTKTGNPKGSEIIDAILKSIYTPLQ